jgi:hypothetical protein
VEVRTIEQADEALAVEQELDFNDVPLESPRIHNISGRPGQGKTVLDFSIADRLHKETDKQVYVILAKRDRPIESYEGMPDHMHSFTGIWELPQDSILVGDDWQRIIHARRAMSRVNVNLDQDWIIDTQTASSIDRNNVLRSNLRWYKRPLKMEDQLGRPELREHLILAKSMDLDKTEALLDTDSPEDLTVKVVNIPLPRYWSDELSVLHRRQPQQWYEKAVKLI